MLKIRGGFLSKKRICLIVRMRTNRGSTVYALLFLWHMREHIHWTEPSKPYGTVLSPPP